MFCLLCRNPEVLENLNSFQHFLRALLCPLGPACSSSSIWVPYSASHGPSIHCTISKFYPAYLFFLPNRELPKRAAFSIFPKFPDKYLRLLCIYMASSCTYILLQSHTSETCSASAHHSVRCFVSSLFLSTKVHFSFDFGLSSSQSFHCSTKQ